MEIVLKEVEQHLSIELGESVQIKSTKSMGGGCINHALKLNTNVGELFLKWNSKCAQDLFSREAEGLQELAKAAKAELIVPKVFAAKDIDETPGFLVQEYLEPGSGGVKADEQLGRGLAIIHQFKNNTFGFSADNYCGATLQNNNWETDWCTFFAEKRLQFLMELIKQERCIANEDYNLIERLLTKLPALLPKSSTSVLIHGDLWSGNYMYTAKGTALIDPAVYYADREMEFAIITMFGGFSQTFFDAYNEINPLEPDWNERNLIYQLYHILNHYYLFGGGYLQQALSIVKRFV